MNQYAHFKIVYDFGFEQKTDRLNGALKRISSILAKINKKYIFSVDYSDNIQHEFCNFLHFQQKLYTPLLYFLN